MKQLTKDIGDPHDLTARQFPPHISSVSRVAQRRALSTSYLTRVLRAALNTQLVTTWPTKRQRLLDSSMLNCLRRCSNAYAGRSRIVFVLFPRLGGDNSCRAPDKEDFDTEVGITGTRVDQVRSRKRDGPVP